ncbi:hypothetical protein, partial [Morganella morganii]|uniref:hypothetical protein n=1 Tax=Morganella morganii TaxID=582 RepID=UPI00195400BE
SAQSSIALAMGSVWLSDILGWMLTLVFVIVVLGLAQFGVTWAGDVKSEWLFLFFAFLSGLE